MSRLPVVGHSVVIYLPVSENWIHTQIAALRRFAPLVIAKRTENLDAFPLPRDGRIVSAYANPWRRVVQKAARRLCRVYPVFETALRHGEAVLLHSHFARGGFEDLPLRRRLGIPQVVSVYGADIWRLGRQEAWRRNYETLFREADLFLAEGAAMRQRMVELGCDPGKIRIHHLGIHPDRIPFVPRRPDPDGTVRVLMAGRAIEKKGMAFGLDAFCRVAGRHPGARLVVMTWGDATYKARLIAGLRQQAEDAGVADRVTWYGLQPYDRYLRITQEAHVYLLPSVVAANGDAEGGCPVTAIELGASGMPIVGFTHCDIPEVVQHGVSGLLAPERDTAALAACLERVLANPDSWEAMGRAARLHVEAQYHAAHQARRLETLYDEVIASGGPAILGDRGDAETTQHAR